MSATNADLARLLQTDQACAGIPLTDNEARDQVEAVRGLLTRHMTSAPYTPHTVKPITVGPHCSHDECSWAVCQDGYAWRPCRKPGCEICGAPPFDTPECWCGDPVAMALMSPADRERAEAHQQRFPLLRRPNDPQMIPDDRYGAKPW